MLNRNDSAVPQKSANLTEICTLCRSNAELFYEMPGRVYYHCGKCSAIFLSPECYVSKEAEEKRYQKHENNISEPGYRKFVEPMVLKIQEKFGPEHQGLDFGSGPGPIITKLLRDRGYSLELYDPFFCNTPAVLEKKYDFIACCEVIEHFHHPEKEFRLLRSLLKPQGVLFCMTALYNEVIDFKTWHYKDDPTHVIYYHTNTLFWIKSQFGFSALETKERLAQFFA